MNEDQPWIPLLVGLGAMTPFIVQALIFRRNQRRERTWFRTTATVLHTSVSTNTDNIRTYIASYNYVDPQGRARNGRGEVRSELGNGTELAIIFDPENPSESQPHRRVGVGHWIAGGLGFLLFLAGVFGVAQGIHIMVTGRSIGE